MCLFGFRLVRVKFIWQCTKEETAGWFLDYWCQLAYETNIPQVMKFADMLMTHLEGILNYCHHTIHTGKPEGINNALKVLKRKHYGFHDTEYYILKAKSTFNGCT